MAFCSICTYLCNFLKIYLYHRIIKRFGTSVIFFISALSPVVICRCSCQVASVLFDSVQSRRRQPTRLLCPWDSPGKNTGVGCHFLLQCIKVKSGSEVAQSCPTLCDPIDGSPPGSSVPGILQTRILEWVAISFSYACMRAKLLQSCLSLCDPKDCGSPGSSVHGILQTRILEWVAISFSRGSCQPRDRTQVSCIAGGFSTN